MAKMGISTLQSYRGAQIFEAVGLDRELVERCFTGTASRVSGVGYDVLAKEVAMRHERAFPDDGFAYPELDPGGLYQWRRRGERHTFNPDTVAKLQHAVAARGSRARLRDLQGVLEGRGRRRRAALHAARAVPLPVRRAADPARRGRAGQRDREALLHRRDVVRLDLARRARDARDRDEPHRRQEQHRRGRRGSRALHPATRTATRGARRSSRSRRDASA